jgi:hypothetical protein
MKNLYIIRHSAGCGVFCYHRRKDHIKKPLTALLLKAILKRYDLVLTDPNGLLQDGYLSFDLVKKKKRKR